MKAELVRIYKAVHTWTGILSGMALFIAFYAGALTVFKEPLQRWASPVPAQQALPLSEAPTLIRRTLAADPAAARDFTLQLQPGTQPVGSLSWQRREAGADEHDGFAVQHFMATLDEAGQARLSRTQPSPLAEFIDVLHRVVGLPVNNEPNLWFMGLVAVLYTLALVSGVIVLLPTLVKDFFALRLGPNLKRMWRDAHNVVGIMSLPFHLVMALTAVVFAFHDPIYEVQDRLVHGGRWASAFPGATAPPPAAPRDPSAMRTPQQLVQVARALSPGFEPTSLQYLRVTTPRATVRVWGRDARAIWPRARGGFVALDPYSGQVQSRDFLPEAQDTANLWISSFFALHMAAFGGPLVPWLYFLLGLAGAWLFYTGNLLWVESRRKRASQAQPLPVQRRDARLMAAATVGVCLGCVCGISSMLLATRWLNGRVGDLVLWHQGLYYAAFFAAVGWAFARGAARAGAELLWCAAALTLAIPLSTVLARLAAPALPMATVPAVELTALVGALALAGMARAAGRRARQGTADNVWSATPVDRFRARRPDRTSRRGSA